MRNTSKSMRGTDYFMRGTGFRLREAGLTFFEYFFLFSKIHRRFPKRHMRLRIFALFQSFMFMRDHILKWWQSFSENVLEDHSRHIARIIFHPAGESKPVVHLFPNWRINRLKKRGRCSGLI
jgi:hypothetical protein